MNKILVYFISTVMFFYSFVNTEYTFARDIMSKHTYVITKGNVQFATTINTLYKSNGRSVFQVLSSTSGIFKLKKDIRKETSLFKILNDKVVSEEYTFSRQKKDSYESYLTKIWMLLLVGDY